jgi:transcriptional regulator with XRE-family HTH domain
MEIQAKSRTVRPDAEAIKRLRLEKGWSVEKLADKAICSIKTVENVEKGSSVYLSTLSKIATALEVEYKTLLPGGESPAEPPAAERRFEVQIKLSVPFGDFDETELVGLVQMLRRLLKGGDIDVAGIEEGSVIVTLRLTEEEMKRLVSTFVHTRGIDAATAPTDEEMQRELALNPDLKHGMRVPREFFGIVEISIPKSDDIPENMSGKTFK